MNKPESQAAAVDSLRRSILSAVRKIPRGKVATYGQIAALVNRPRNARQVGTVLSSLCSDSNIPWHRVVNAQGYISSRNSPASEDLQRILLEGEGVELTENGHIVLTDFQWKPRKT